MIYPVLLFIRDNYIEIARLTIEMVFIVLLLRFSLRRPKSRELMLENHVVNALIEDFQPDDIVDSYSDEFCDTSVPFFVSDMIELADYDFYDIKNDNKDEIVEVLRNYGVGTCGPPGFYGTLDIHLDLEKLISERLGTQETILYSNSFTCINSVITCFCKHGDVVFYHENSNEAIVRGISITKGSSISFKSLSDLEDKIKRYSNKWKRNFIITEGILRNTGEILDICRLIQIKKRHGMRLILDESLSLPLLGKRGVTSYFRIDVNDIDIIIGSLSHVYCANGGFSAGNVHAVDHQRLSAPSYCFSASLPGYLAKSAILNIESDKIEDFGSTSLIRSFHSIFRQEKYTIISHIDSPMVIISKKDHNHNIEDSELRFLKKVKSLLEKDRIRIGVVESPFPSLRVCIKYNMSKDELGYVAEKLNAALSTR